MNLRSATCTALAIIVALTLGLGSASAAEHGKTLATASSAAPTTAPVAAAGGRGRPDLDVLTGYPKEVHTDERMSEEEIELAEAAPHTLGRFHAGPA